MNQSKFAQTMALLQDCPAGWQVRHLGATSYSKSSISALSHGAVFPSSQVRDRAANGNELIVETPATRERGFSKANLGRNQPVFTVGHSNVAAACKAEVLQDKIVATPTLQSRWRGWEGETGRRVKKKEHRELVASVLEALESAADVKTALAPWTGRLGKKEHAIILNSQRNCQSALAVYSWIKSLEAYEPNVFLYNIMFKFLARAGEWDLVDKFWEEMVADKVAPTNSTFSTLIDACGRAGKKQMALTWFDSLLERGLEPDEFVINTMINLHKRTGDLKAAEMFFNGSWRHGSTISPAHRPAERRRKRDLVAYNTMIGMYGRAGDYIEASRMFADMMKAGVSPDSITFNTMIYICGCFGRREEAEALFKRMEHKGAVADETTYNILISIAGKEGDGGSALQYFNKMKAASKEPDDVTYRTLLSVISTSGMVKETEEILSLARELKYSIGQAVIAQVVSMYVHAGLLENAHQSIQSFLLSEGLTFVTYAVIINVCGERGFWQDAAKVFRLYLEDRTCIPNVGVYNAMIKAFGLSKRYKEALDVFKTLEENDVTADDITCNTVIQMCAAAGLVSEMREIWNVMRNKGFKPSQPTYGAVLGLHGRLGQVKEAVLAFKEMQNDGLVADGICYGALLNVFCEAGSVKDAEKTFWTMKTTGFCEDSKAYTSLMKLYCKLGLIKEAKELFLEVEKCGFSGDAYLSNLMIDILGKAGSLQEAERRYHQLEDQGQVNKVTLTIMLNLYKDADLLQQAVGVAKQLQDAGWLNDLEGFCSVMGLYARAGNLQAAAKIYLDMQNTLSDHRKSADDIMEGILKKAGLVAEASGSVESDIEVTPPEIERFVRLINIRALAGQHDEAVAMCDTLRQDETELNVGTYNAMIHAYGAAGKFDLALRLFMEMQSGGLSPDVVTYTNIITVYCKMGLLEGVTRMFKRMKLKGCEPSIATYHRIIEYYKEAGRLDLAAMVSHEMRFAEYLQQSRSQPSAQAQVAEAGFAS